VQLITNNKLQNADRGKKPKNQKTKKKTKRAASPPPLPILFGTDARQKRGKAAWVRQKTMALSWFLL